MGMSRHVHAQACPPLTVVATFLATIPPCYGGAASRPMAQAEPTVTAVATTGGVVELRITPPGGAPGPCYRLNLSERHSPATEPTKAIRDWCNWRLGAFLCFNTNQFTGSEHCHTKDPRVYAPPELDVAGWIRVFKDAGMRYAVLTTRHTSGFLLWDSATTSFDVASSGNPTDVVKAFVDECNRQGIAPGLYYCMWGGKKYRPTPNARAVILAQLYELATRYGKIPYFWIDMMNWAPDDLPPQQVYDALKGLRPDAVVILNQHVQDGREIRYFPTDVVNGELVPPPPEGHNPRRLVKGVSYHLPFEYCLCSQRRDRGIKYDPLGPSCWFTYGQGRTFPASHSFDAEAIYQQLRLAWDRGASNALLATAPDHTGRMRSDDVKQLLRLGKRLRQAQRDAARP